MMLLILEWIMQLFDGQKLFSVSNPAISLWFCVVGGQPCVSMEIRASQKETGYSQVRRLVIQCNHFPSFFSFLVFVA